MKIFLSDPDIILPQKMLSLMNGNIDKKRLYAREFRMEIYRDGGFVQQVINKFLYALLYQLYLGTKNESASNIPLKGNILIFMIYDY